MKRAFCFALAFLLFISAGCGKKTPNKVYDDQTVRAYQKTIEVLDDLLNYDIDPENAVDIIEDCSVSIDGEDAFAATNSLYLHSISARIHTMLYNTGRLSADDYKVIQEMRDTLEASLYD